MQGFCPAYCGSIKNKEVYKMTYKELLKRIAKAEDFDWEYTYRHMLVEECFNTELALNKEWEDVADADSMEELPEEELKLFCIEYYRVVDSGEYVKDYMHRNAKSLKEMQEIMVNSSIAENIKDIYEVTE